MQWYAPWEIVNHHFMYVSVVCQGIRNICGYQFSFFLLLFFNVYIFLVKQIKVSKMLF